MLIYIGKFTLITIAAQHILGAELYLFLNKNTPSQDGAKVNSARPTHRVRFAPTQVLFCLRYFTQQSWVVIARDDIA